MSEIKLKNCPFCGGKSTLIKILNGFTPYCLEEKCIGFHINKRYKTLEEAIDGWNTRKPTINAPEKLEREYLGKPVSEEFERGIKRAIEIVKECAE